MLTGLLWTAFLMGLGGIVHCAAMCGAPCAAMMPRGIPVLALVGRCLAYAALGLLASASAGLFAGWGQGVGMFQPIWLMLQLAAVCLGVWMLFKGQLPQALNVWGVQTYHRLRQKWMGEQAPNWLKASQPWMPLVAGMAWAVMPCGLLYAALVVATLSPTPWGGGAVMLAFGLPSALGVWLGPAVMRRLVGARSAVQETQRTDLAVAPIVWLRASSSSGADQVHASRMAPSLDDGARSAQALIDPKWAIRLAGLSLALIAAWAVSHQLIAQWQAWCA